MNNLKQNISTSFFEILTKHALVFAVVSVTFISFSVNAQNTILGDGALHSNTSGVNNTALGYRALYSNTTGGQNSATGAFALQSNTTGNYNTATGRSALSVNTTGRYNTATGDLALYANTSGEYNTATGANSLQSNTTGESNSAFGISALRESTTGHFNTAVGVSALRGSTIHSENTAVGYQALQNEQPGSSNTAIGYMAGTIGTIHNTTAIGANAKATVNHSIQLGDALITKIFAGTGNSAKFIVGTIQIKGGAPGNGKVLTSDALGNASWQSYPNELWTVSGSDLNYTPGIVSIGTDLAPNGYKLAVGGKIVSEEVVLKLIANWPDYVFEDNYKLPKLTEVERYIRAHKHLADVPTQEQVAANGIDVGEMNAVLLKKIEELTLYLIELDKQVSSNQNEINALKENR